MYHWLGMAQQIQALDRAYGHGFSSFAYCCGIAWIFITLSLSPIPLPPWSSFLASRYFVFV
jgi:hypothetical protein